MIRRCSTHYFVCSLFWLNKIFQYFHYFSLCDVFLKLFLQNVGVIAVAASVIPLILIPVVLLMLIFLYLRSLYLRTSRDLKRLESTSMLIYYLYNLFWEKKWSERADKSSSCLFILPFLQLGVQFSHTCPLPLMVFLQSELPDQKRS